MIFNTHAIVIRKMDFRDYDRIITVYTSEFGKIKLLARSVRKPKAKLISLTELFTFCEFRIFLREASSFGKVTGGIILDSNSLIRYDIEKFYEASYICEVMDAMTPDIQPNIQKFFLLKETLMLLNKNVMNQKDDFVEKLLHLTGFGIKKGISLDK
ncbi:MAG TPA: DNA repair protein RecO, partial [Elusimicrobia bacterium]|nr:DNA repair protein RecO [Elusimicrobiota bacterium]